MLDEKFMRLVAHLDGGFGTENVGPLLYAQIRFCRPRSLLEVGAGYTTLFMLQALKDVKAQDLEARDSGVFRCGRTEFFDRGYEPLLTTLDDFSHDGTVARSVQAASTALGLDSFADFRNRDFRGFSTELDAGRLPIDFVWFDCGGLEEYVDFVGEYWDLINPDGGIVVFHSTKTNLSLHLFERHLHERHLRDAGKTFELLSLLEPHKQIQNSVTLLRMTSAARTRMYTAVP